MDRELATIEWALEKLNGKEENRPKPVEQSEQLERNLNDLFSLRRRCTRYLEWVADAQKQSRLRGQPPWPKESVVNSKAKQEAEILLGDFDAVHAGFQATLQRAEKGIKFVSILVAIVGGKIGLQESTQIGRLTIIGVVLALVLTPLSTISAILTIPGRYSVEGGDRSYIVFLISLAFSIPLVPLIMFGNDGLDRIRRLLRLVLKTMI